MYFWGMAFFFLLYCSIQKEVEARRGGIISGMGPNRMGLWGYRGFFCFVLFCFEANGCERY